MRIIRSQDYELKPWKNGLGRTREIVNQSAGAKLIWRLSLAVVERDGPFSNFTGFDRILTVVKGKGMRLIGNEKEHVARPLTPIRFRGSESIEGKCLSVPIENFNLIFDPEWVKAEVKVLTGAQISDITGRAGEITILHVLDGSVSCHNGVILDAQDTVVFKGRTANLMTENDARCAVVVLAPPCTT